VTVVTGRIDRVDGERRVVALGTTVIRVPESVALHGIEPGTSVTITYEERGGEMWATDIRRVRQ
jgi:S-adenosylmethionine:tRNA-ribosyltransferase-isomerase (queuine synthetase)